MKKLIPLVTALGIVATLMFSILSANTYTRLSEDSISKVCFVTIKEYRWTDKCEIQKYSLDCDTSGNLTYTVTTKDGEKIELFGSVNSCSDNFIAQYKNLYGYAAYLTEQFENSEFIIEGNVSGLDNMEKHYKNNYPQIWAELEKIVALQD